MHNGGREVKRTDRATLIHRLANDVHDAAQRLSAHRHLLERGREHQCVFDKNQRIKPTQRQPQQASQISTRYGGMRMGWHLRELTLIGLPVLSTV